MRGIYIGRSSPGSNTPPWFEEAFLVYLAIGLILVILVRGRSKIAKSLGLSFSEMCMREYRLFTLLAVPFWPGLWVWDVMLIRVAKKQKPNQSPQHNAGSRPSSGDSSASETPSSLGPRG
jgi:hypothetical protein